MDSIGNCHVLFELGEKLALEMGLSPTSCADPSTFVSSILRGFLPGTEKTEQPKGKNTVPLRTAGRTVSNTLLLFILCLGGKGKLEVQPWGELSKSQLTASPP